MFLLIFKILGGQINCRHFNTSHVSINRHISFYLSIVAGISIHPMFLLIRFLYRSPAALTLISIHPMFLLIFLIRANVVCKLLISIHPMFLLIKDSPI